MAELFRVTIKPELLTWARETSGEKPEEIAASVGIKVEQLLAWEAGEAMPTWNQLKQLANKTKRPLAAFYLPEVPLLPRKPRDFRTCAGSLRGEFSAKLLGMIREARSLRTRALELMDETDVPTASELPLFSLKNNPNDCANVLRNYLGVTVEEQIRWKDSSAALSIWRDVLFDHGVLVVQLPIDRREARGLSENYDRLNLIAVSSKDLLPEARIFTIFHELCHLCLRYGGISEPRVDMLSTGVHSFVERFCNKVAADFLLPRDNPAVAERLESIVQSGIVDLDALRRTSRQLKVSQSAILLTMVDAKMAPTSEYDRITDLWESLPPPKARKDVRIRVPVKRLATVGKSYALLVFQALDLGRISTHEACNCLDLGPRWLAETRATTYSGVLHV